MTSSATRSLPWNFTPDGERIMSSVWPKAPTVHEHSTAYQFLLMLWKMPAAPMLTSSLTVANWVDMGGAAGRANASKNALFSRHFCNPSMKTVAKIS